MKRYGLTAFEKDAGFPLCVETHTCGLEALVL